MDPSRKASLEKQCQTLRGELKDWEYEFGKANKGSKPSRDDIKAAPKIAKKYKDYHRLRDILSGKVEDEPLPPPKRKATAPEPAQTPVKRTRHSTVPEVRPDPVASTPSADKTAPSPAPPTSIGPTPHRDGKVLGLFAFLDDDNQTKTPSKGLDGNNTRAGLAAETPSRTGASEDDFKLGKTPSSLSKRRYLDHMVTPLKPTDGNAQNGGTTTPKSISKLQFGTPSFLRRRPLASVEEMPEYESPQKLRKTSRKPFARGLSAIVANLRKVEEEQFDEDEEAMREMEAEAAGAPPAVPRAAVVPVEPIALVPDSQPGVKMLGGFDDEAAYDSPVEGQTDRGLPMREYKKKAPKRTTRKVNMKPRITRRPDQESDHSGSDNDDEEEAAIPETQVRTDLVGDDFSSDAEFAPSSGDEGEAKTKARGRKRSASALEGKGDGDKGVKEKPKEEGKVRKVARKVNELAHANFRRLKLRNYGAKGGPGFNSRFRRR